MPTWDGRVRSRADGRLVWWAPTAGGAYWAPHWEEQITPRYYAAADTWRAASDPFGRFLVQHLTPRRGTPMLEAGCGAGVWMLRLRTAGFDVEGIEQEAPVVEAALSVRPDLPIRTGDVTRLDVPDATYGAYLSFGVVEHDPAGPERFLAEARRVLRPGGVAVLSVPHFGPLRRMWTPRTVPPRGLVPPRGFSFFQYGFTARDFTACVRRAGLTPLEVRTFHVDRLLLEECRLYRTLRGSRFAKASRAAAAWLGRFDGHMVAVAAVRTP